MSKERSMKILTFIIAFTVCTASYAGVNLKNGDFYINYTDIIVPGGGQDLMIVRTYNSKSAYNGWFGVGWGSDYETYLKPSPDGTVIVYENGGGAKSWFSPKEPMDPVAGAKLIVEKMREGNYRLDGKAAEEMVNKLAQNSELRMVYANKFNISGSVPVGTVMYSHRKGMQELRRTQEGYERILADDTTKEYFNEDGKLVKIFQVKEGYSVNFEYKGTKLVSIKDSQSKQLFFEWSPSGHIESIWSAGDKKVVYKYNGDDLIDSIDMSTNHYAYEYDTNHNLTKIKYDDGSSKEITYDQKNMFVTGVKERGGDWTNYKYDSNPKNPDLNYWTTVTKNIGVTKEVSKYEYEIKIKPDGSRYNHRILTELNGVKTETIYSECCSLPIKITKGKHITNFEYNKRGLLTKKTSTTGEYVELEYHPTLNKITRVVNHNGWTVFKYDKVGNLSSANNSSGQKVMLVYDHKSRITKMMSEEKDEKSKKTLAFEYNGLGKPSEITMNGVGKINVSYDNYGEIKKVDSSAGHKMALQVTMAFQSLLSIVKPAGVDLNM